VCNAGLRNLVHLQSLSIEVKIVRSDPLLGMLEVCGYAQLHAATQLPGCDSACLQLILFDTQLYVHRCRVLLLPQAVASCSRMVSLELHNSRRPVC
jgi:hypothetical protein